jgi:hypothetical protein
MEKKSDENSLSYPKLIRKVFEKYDFGLKPREIARIIRLNFNIIIDQQILNMTLSRLYQTGELKCFEHWHFATGRIYHPTEEGVFKRLTMIEDKKWSIFNEKERGVLNKVRGKVVVGDDIRPAMSYNAWRFMIFKLGKQAPYEIDTEVKFGRDFETGLKCKRIVVHVKKNYEKRLEGAGIVSWLSWTKLNNHYILFDNRLPESQIIEDIKRLGKWLSEEGEKWQKRGEWFESYLQDTCDMIDRYQQWVGVRINCQRRVRLAGISRRGHEYDYIIDFQIGPKELGLEPIKFIFSCKSGMIGVQQIMDFYHALSDTVEFRSPQGDFRRNIVPVLVINKNMSSKAWSLCGQLGIRVIREIQLREVWEKLTGKELSFREYCRGKMAEEEASKQLEKIAAKVN